MYLSAYMSDKWTHLRGVGDAFLHYMYFWPVYGLNVSCYLKWVWHLCYTAEVASSRYKAQLYDILGRKFDSSQQAQSHSGGSTLSISSFIPTFLLSTEPKEKGVMTELYWMRSQTCCLWKLKRKRVREQKREWERDWEVAWPEECTTLLHSSHYLLAQLCFGPCFDTSAQHVLLFKQMGNGKEASIIPEPALHSIRLLFKVWETILRKPTWPGWRHRQSGQHDCLQRWSTVSKEIEKKFNYIGMQ